MGIAVGPLRRDGCRIDGCVIDVWINAVRVVWREGGKVEERKSVGVEDLKLNTVVLI